MTVLIVPFYKMKAFYVHVDSFIIIIIIIIIINSIS